MSYEQEMTEHWPEGAAATVMVTATHRRSGMTVSREVETGDVQQARESALADLRDLVVSYYRAMDEAEAALGAGEGDGDAV